MEPKYQVVLGIIVQCMLRWCITRGQVLMKELQEYKIDPYSFNGTELYTNLTIDQIIMRTLGGIGMAQNLMLADDGTVLAELDMKLTQDQFFRLYEQPQSESIPAPPVRGNPRKKRKAVRGDILRWPGGIVPYRFVINHFREKEEYMIRMAMTEWEKYTCVRFKPATRSDRNVVRFQNGQGCNSQLGMVGGEQPLNLDDNGCRFKGLYLHEIGHALGLVHEHQLPTRDSFIRILYHNVQPNMRIWFNKYSSQEVDQMKVPYEYSSVMHYGITAFSSDGQSQTIEALQKNKEETIGRVYRKELAFSDVKIVNLMYNCSSHCSKAIVCKNGGFVDQNCKCICPDGTDSCTGADDTHSLDPSCFNAHGDWPCLVWANQGECDRNPKFMLDGCKKACNLCGEKEKQSDTHITTWAWQWLCVYTNVCPKKWTIDECSDVYDADKCERWRDNGDCIVNKKWMEKHCKRTCKLCKNSDTSSETSCSNKHSNLAECEKWAAEGECQINSRWMPKNCQKSCHLCGKDVEKPTQTPDTDEDQDVTCEDLHNTVECQGWASNGECQLNPDWMIPNCRKSCKKCRGDDTDTGKQECKNIWDDVQCAGWARDRECMKNSAWMKRNCYKACSECGGDTVTQSIIQTTPKPTSATEDTGICVNNHRSDKDCSTWARHGHCQINTWMLKHCAKACNTCKKTEEIITTTTNIPDKKDVTTSKKTVVGDCEDGDINCPSWAEHGFCEDNPGRALVLCKKSCNACSAGETRCFDRHQLCPVWKKGGQCMRNGGYMLRNCRRSCNVC